MPRFFRTMDKLKPIFDFTDRVLMIICKLLLIADIGITSFAVAGRYISFIPDPMWSEELVLSAMAYMAVLSAAIALRHHRHIRMSAFDKWIPKTMLHIMDLIVDAFVLAFGVFMVKLGFEYAFTLGANGFYISIPSLSRFWAFFPVPLAGLCMIIFEIEIILSHIKAFFEKSDGGPSGITLTEEVNVALKEANLTIDDEATTQGGTAQ
ncbi:MAG: TRAP transporter small permease [Firmicutes bacterium]|nr:TRAP transporter small permease [Bacillota bacterium]